VCRNERRSLGSDPFDRDLGRRVRPSGFDDPLDELDRVEWLGTQVDSSRIELIREQYLVDDPPEPFGFLGDQRDEPVAAGLVERKVVTEKCLRGSIDRGERRT